MPKFSNGEKSSKNQIDTNFLKTHKHPTLKSVSLFHGIIKKWQETI